MRSHLKSWALNRKICVQNFQLVFANMAAVPLQIGYAIIASAPHSEANGFNNLLAIAAATVVDFMKAATIKKFVKDPKFAAAAASAPASGDGAAAEKEEKVKKQQLEPEKDDDMGFSLSD